MAGGQEALQKQPWSGRPAERGRRTRGGWGCSDGCCGWNRGNLEDTCSLMLLLWGRRLWRGRRLSWKLWRSLCWQTDVADHSSSGGKLRLYSDSIHSSLKARKRPSGEVITQEALLQGRHRRRLWGVGMADGAMRMSEQYQKRPWEGEGRGFMR